MSSVAEVKAQFSAYLKESEEGLVIVTRNGRPVAALPAVRDDEELERLILGHSARLRTLLETARQQIREGEGIPHEDFWAGMEEEKPQKARGSRGKKT
ncbi:MAG TPA: type II toxin-antitoxin system prevent-host-death family antitoxin [Thermoanaerobaculia bacterium]|nr:type II toxin-antitoxin system prevent-host-death family antitoxin [Thermoanaerobaculia bacterium]